MLQRGPPEPVRTRSAAPGSSAAARRSPRGGYGLFPTRDAVSGRRHRGGGIAYGEDEELIQTLLEREPELRRYYEEHVDLERRLGAFQQKVYLSPEEELEKRRLQKLKLAGKDRIMEILSRHRAH